GYGGRYGGEPRSRGMWLIALGTATLAGVLLGDLHPLAAQALASAVALATLAAALSWRSRSNRAVALAAWALGAGALRASVVGAERARSEATVAQYYGRSITLSGQLAEAPSLS